VELDGEHAVLEVHEACPGVAPNDPAAIFGGFQNLQLRRRRRDAVASEPIAAGLEDLLDRWRWVGPRIPHRVQHLVNADGIPDLEGPELPAEPPLHRAIDVID